MPEKSGSFQFPETQGLVGSVEVESAGYHSPVLSRVSSTESCYFEEKEPLETVLDDVALDVFVESTMQVKQCSDSAFAS